ncbi:hypothetical protein ACETRX_30155 [Labrys portucalensis]|uniref:DUF4304 domain-containing protein n=1 Tax=Labrys neptuniae TaxID=376174 RepID=A0ABV6ZP34_9HYPH
MENLNDKYIIRGAKDIIRESCLQYGFRKAGNYWYRAHYGVAQAIHLDRRVVGKYPYYVEAAVDLLSRRDWATQPFRVYRCRILIERATPLGESLLQALDPSKGLEGLDERPAVLRHILDDFIAGELDPVRQASDIVHCISKRDENRAIIVTQGLRDELQSSATR